MTQREFFTIVANGSASIAYKVNDEVVHKTVNLNDDEVKEYAEMAIKKLDEKNEKRKTEGNKTAKENAPIKENIMKIFEENPQTVFTAKNIADKMDISTQKSSALLRQLTDKINVFEVKDEKKNKVKGYQLK